MLEDVVEGKLRTEGELLLGLGWLVVLRNAGMAENTTAPAIMMQAMTAIIPTIFVRIDLGIPLLVIVYLNPYLL
jgi:hypothetical protein